jgi:hypothetical protein
LNKCSTKPELFVRTPFYGRSAIIYGKTARAHSYDWVVKQFPKITKYHYFRLGGGADNDITCTLVAHHREWQRNHHDNNQL